MQKEQWESKAIVDVSRLETRRKPIRQIERSGATCERLKSALVVRSWRNWLPSQGSSEVVLGAGGACDYRVP